MFQSTAAAAPPAHGSDAQAPGPWISPTDNPVAYTGEDCAAAHVSRHKAAAAACWCHGHVSGAAVRRCGRSTAFRSARAEGGIEKRTDAARIAGGRIFLHGAAARLGAGVHGPTAGAMPAPIGAGAARSIRRGTRALSAGARPTYDMAPGHPRTTHDARESGTPDGSPAALGLPSIRVLAPCVRA